MKLEKPVERRPRIGGIVVAPPQLGSAAVVAPARGLLVEGLPAAHSRRFSNKAVAGPPLASHGGKLRNEGPARARPTASARLSGDSVPGGTTATMPRSASSAARSACSVSRAVPNGTRTARSAQHKVSMVVL